MKDLKQAVDNLEVEKLGEEDGRIVIQAWTQINEKNVVVEASYGKDFPENRIDLIHSQLVTFLLGEYYLGDEDEEHYGKDNKVRKYVFNL